MTVASVKVYVGTSRPKHIASHPRFVCSISGSKKAACKDSKCEPVNLQSTLLIKDLFLKLQTEPPNRESTSTVNLYRARVVQD